MYSASFEVPPETLQPEALDHRSLGVQRRERRVGAAAFGDRIDGELPAELGVDAPGALAERARGGRRLERRAAAVRTSSRPASRG